MQPGDKYQILFLSVNFEANFHALERYQIEFCWVMTPQH